MSVFCTNCGAPVNPGTKFCTSCGAPVVGAPAAAPAASVKNLWALITGGVLAFLGLLGLILGIVIPNSGFGMGILLHGWVLSVIWILSALALSLFFISLIPKNGPSQLRILTWVFLGFFILAWFLIFLAFVTIDVSLETFKVLSGFSTILFLVSGILAAVAYRGMLKQPGFLMGAVIATLVLTFFWFLIFPVTDSSKSFAFVKFVVVLTPILYAAAGVFFTLHYVKAPETKLF